MNGPARLEKSAAQSRQALTNPGIGAALALSGIVQGSFVYVNAHDPIIYIGVLVLMLAVTGCACYIPARRAFLVDPNITLRT